MNKIKYLFAMLFFCIQYAKTQTLSEPLLLSFPKITATNFVIFEEESKTILHEKNANNTINLYTILNENKFVDAIFDIDSKTCMIFSVKNKQNCRFSCVIYGYSSNSQEQMNLDKENITNWLNQFFVYKISKQSETIAKIPIFYSKQKYIMITYEEDVDLLMSIYLNKNIVQKIQYKTMLKAPIQSHDIVGRVSYQTSTFAQPILKNINAQQNIAKCSKWNAILDSISYTIFAIPFQS